MLNKLMRKIQSIAVLYLQRIRLWLLGILQPSNLCKCQNHSVKSSSHVRMGFSRRIQRQPYTLKCEFEASFPMLCIKAYPGLTFFIVKMNLTWKVHRLGLLIPSTQVVRYCWNCLGEPVFMAGPKLLLNLASKIDWRVLCNLLLTF